MATREQVLDRFINNRESMIINPVERMNASLDKMIENAERKLYLHNKAVEDHVKQGVHIDIAQLMGYGNKSGRKTGD